MAIGLGLLKLILLSSFIGIKQRLRSFVRIQRQPLVSSRFAHVHHARARLSPHATSHYFAALAIYSSN